MLVKLLTVGRCIYHLVIVSLRLQRRYASVYRLTLHHHARKAPVGIVVHTLPFIERIVAQVVQVNLSKSFLLCTSQYRLVNEAL